MIRQLKEKGFQYNPTEDVLVGEFNGTDVEVAVVTNKNKVCRIAVRNAIPLNERYIRTKFNRLCEQFENNPKYVFSTHDFTIPEDEDIAYEILAHNKRYEAVFFQKPMEDHFQRPVWFMISEFYGKYYIIMYYDNEYNHANGEDL